MENSPGSSRAFGIIEALESRIAPATLLALDDANHLVRFHHASPGGAVFTDVSGLGAGESLVGIDIRPDDGLLYGITSDGSHAGRLYLIAPATGAATFVGKLTANPADATAPFAALDGSTFAVDFDPLGGVLRIVSDLGQSLSVRPTDGLTTTDVTVGTDAQRLGAISHTNSYPGTTETALYAIDTISHQLLGTGSNGILNAVGTFPENLRGPVGFDIGHGLGETFAAFTVGLSTHLYRIGPNPGGAVTIDDRGAIGTRGFAVRDLAVVQHTWTGAGGDFFWTTADNWAAGLVPDLQDSLIFPQGAMHKISVNNAPQSAREWGTLRFTGGGYTLSHKVDFPISYTDIRSQQVTGANSISGSFVGSFLPGSSIEVTHASASLELQIPIGGSGGVVLRGEGFLSTPGITGSFRLRGLTVKVPSLEGVSEGWIESGTLQITSDYAVRAADRTIHLIGGTLAGNSGVSGLDATGGVVLSGAKSLQLDRESLTAGTTLRFEIPGPGETLEPLTIYGGVSLNGARLELATLSGITPSRLVLLRNNHFYPINGTFAGVPEGAAVTLGGRAYLLTYHGGYGDDVEITAIGPTPTIAANGRSATFTDADGDLATVAVSKGRLTAHDFVLRDLGAGRAQLELVDLDRREFSGANLSITATRQGASGDGAVDVGRIDATGVDLGSVKITGDLGSIDCGNPRTKAPALISLDVHSLGARGLDIGAADLESDIDGAVTRMRIRGDVHGAMVHVFSSENRPTISFSDGRTPNASIGTLTVDGSVVGTDTAFSGAFVVHDSIGSARVGGSIIGGKGKSSGVLQVAARLGTLSIGGSVIGGDGSSSGKVEGERLGPASIGGSLEGGTGYSSGNILFYSANVLTVRGSVIGDTGPASGFIRINAKSSRISIGGSLDGGPGEHSGSLEIGSTGKLSVRGSIVGGGAYSGTINTDQTNVLELGGSLLGGSGNFSGILSGSYDRVTIGGDVRGGGGYGSGSLDFRTTGSLAIDGSVYAGDGIESGHIDSYAIDTLRIQGSVLGTEANRVTVGAWGSKTFAGDLTGSFKTLFVQGSVAFTDIIGRSPDARLGRIAVGGDWTASNVTAGIAPGPDNLLGTADDALAEYSGYDEKPAIFSRIASISIGGKVIGTAATGDHFGFVAQQIGALSIGRDDRLSVILPTSPVTLGDTGDFTARTLV